MDDLLFIPFLVGQVRDLADKLESWDHNMSRGSYAIEREGSDKKTEDKLSKATKDSCKITTEVLHGIMTQVVKDKLFNCIQKWIKFSKSFMKQNVWVPIKWPR